MSDWSFSEIDEIVFEEFGGVDGHTVPYEGGQLLKESAASNGFLTRLQHDTKNDLGKSTGDKGLKVENVSRAKERTALCSAFDNGPSGLGGCLHATGQARSVPLDPLHLVDHSVILPSQDGQMPAAAGLPFLENDKEREKDLPYYDWRDINDFDEIDQMFSNCDPTFGQWSNTDSLSWLSSCNDLYGPEDAYNSGLPSSSSQLSPFDSRQEQNDAKINSSAESRQLPTYNQQNSCSSYLSYELAANAGQVSQVDLPVKQFKGQRASKFRGEDQISTSTSSRSLFAPDDMQHIGDQKHPVSIFTAPDPSPFQLLPKQNHFVDSESSSYLPKFQPHSQPNGKHLVYQDHFVHSSSITIDDGSFSPEPCTYITDSISKSIAASPGFLTKGHDMKLKEIIQQPGVGSSELVTSVHDHHNNLQESSYMPSTDDNNSIKASSFKQLHDVMDQLDVRTKLCIRDSLYRLAKSAEKRHNFTCTSNGSSEYTAGAYGKGKSVKSMEYTNVETETNPIDRSIAHLLFHRSEDPAISANGVMPLEPHMIPEQINGPISRNQ